ncbi:MAG: hypothetical protein QHH75_08965 [Bacillota bacterium]|nr:hypothetical protein [Bacillota bacterium]
MTRKTNMAVANQNPWYEALKTTISKIQLENDGYKKRIHELEREATELRKSPNYYPGSDLSAKVNGIQLDVNRLRSQINANQERLDKFQKQLALGYIPSDKLVELINLKAQMKEQKAVAEESLAEIAASRNELKAEIEQLELEGQFLRQFGKTPLEVKRAENIQERLRELKQELVDLDEGEKGFKAVMLANECQSSITLPGLETPVNKLRQLEQELDMETRGFINDIQHEWDQQMAGINKAAEALREAIKGLGYIKAKVYLRDKELAEAGYPETGLAGKCQLPITEGLQFSPQSIRGLFCQGESIGKD